jgi:hypothetical protein
MRAEKAEYLRDMARELATLAEADGLPDLAHILRMAEAEANYEVGQSESTSSHPHPVVIPARGADGPRLSRP